MRITLAAALGLIVALFPLLLAGCAGGRPIDHRTIAGEKNAIGRVLDNLHDAAARVDEDRYFALFAPEAVFLGADATERWPLDAFRAFARPHFQGESAWVYRPIERHIDLSPGGSFAWFDERLHNARLGECRGSGALRRINGRWRITQYNLTITIPNALADDVAAMIRAWEQRSDADQNN